VSRDSWIVVGVIVAVIAVVTFIWALRLLLKLVALRRTLGTLGASGKVAFWGAVAYAIFPIDLLPDPIYLDDMAVLGGALFFLTRLARRKATLEDAIPHVRKVAELGARSRRYPSSR
jgi:uncharacterized membrane protein YkvA (DUF1232 family)